MMKRHDFQVVTITKVTSLSLILATHVPKQSARRHCRTRQPRCVSQASSPVLATRPELPFYHRLLLAIQDAISIHESGWNYRPSTRVDYIDIVHGTTICLDIAKYCDSWLILHEVFV
ncbi:hypothetical protein BC936DRAFT_149552 [Jimgerdemannia flammicorona]|uniref:Uncharacterized protein n=1 Tax=Jimgerdemannia flammicorona TaxID=994334 RepID=A0A433D0M4_9FUNG|nr:hypothetical protein BC936DRAFT_149552 [Jimgerdemannia flammicorona]